MALPDFLRQALGTAVIWGEAGASGVTKTLTFEALAAGSARMGASADLGALWDQLYFLMLIIESGTAPTAGGTVDLYMACSRDGTTFPGGVTGSDGAWPSDGNEDEWAKQLDGNFALSLKATNDGNVVQVQAPILWRPSGRFVAPVVDNNMDQAIRDEVTATNNDSRVILIPLQLSIEDLYA